MGTTDDLMDIGSVTRARPGDRLAPDRVSDFGPADVDRLVQQRADNMTSGFEIPGGVGGVSTVALAALIAAVALIR